MSYRLTANHGFWYRLWAAIKIVWNKTVEVEEIETGFHKEFENLEKVQDFVRIFNIQDKFEDQRLPEISGFTHKDLIS